MEPPLMSDAAQATVFENDRVVAPGTIGRTNPGMRIKAANAGAALAQPIRIDLTDWVICGLTIVAVVTVCWYAFAQKLIDPLFLAVAQASSWSAVVRPSLLWALTGSLFLVFRTALWLYYRPFHPATHENAPTLTVIIPAYNEGRMVKNAIYSVLEADYPPDRLELFVVDDGSTDDTWNYIQEAASQYPHMITPVRFPKNRGKRAGLEEGFRRARGEIVITVDSDSVVERESLLAMTGPFINPRIGAVAGKVVVYNRAQGMIPRMLQVRYVLAFDFLRAVQSTYGTVYCCPGALSAYRTSVVRQVLDRWVGQMFLGNPCTFGEDRAMTNFILSAGYDTVFQRTARVQTVVPWKYRKLCKMYLRWDRSYVRECIHFMRIVWRRSPWSMIVSVIDMTITNLRFPVGWASLALLAVFAIHDPTALIRFFCVMALFSTLNMFYYWYTERSWLFPYGILYSYFSFLALLWIFPYALMTLRVRTWGTR
jgi:hyaluronan synthase